MNTWKLNLSDDYLQKTHMRFASIEERVAKYWQYYIPSHRQSNTELSSDSTVNISSTAINDIRTSESPFSTLLCFYDISGHEFTFSQKGMRCVKRQLPWQGHYHTHDYIEILYVIKGNFEQSLLGERQHFKAGEFIITDCNLEHADYLAGQEDTAVIFLCLQSSYLDYLLFSYDQEDALQRFFFHALRRQCKEQSYIHLQPTGSQYSGLLKMILENLIQEDYFPLAGTNKLIEGNLIRLLQILCRDYTMQLHSSDRESKEKALLYELERYIRLHIERITARELEDTFHYHRNYFNLLLRKYRNLSFQKYVQKIRLDHAASLLRNTSLPIKEIALQIGYQNSSHFYHLFEAQFHVSPAEYRKKG